MADRGVRGPVGGEVAAGAAVLLVALEEFEAPHSGLADAAGTELAVVVEEVVGTATAKITLIGFYFSVASKKIKILKY